MTREIKFRAWSNSRNEWDYMTLGDVLNRHSRNLALGEADDFDGGKWCEFTGLKDKNGSEIYEGDIVIVSGIITGAEGLRPGFIWSDDDVFVIAWDNDIAAWSVQDEDFDTTDVVSVTYRNQAIQLIQNGSGEVVGNIYENGDLLK